MTYTTFGDAVIPAQGDGALRSAERVLPLVFDLIAPTSVVDVGCGDGAWLSVAKSLGVARVLGVDNGPAPAGLRIESESVPAAEPVADRRASRPVRPRPVPRGRRPSRPRRRTPVGRSAVRRVRRRAVLLGHPRADRLRPPQRAVAALLGGAVRRVRIPHGRLPAHPALGRPERRALLRAERAALRAPLAARAGTHACRRPARRTGSCRCAPCTRGCSTTSPSPRRRSSRTRARACPPRGTSRRSGKADPPPRNRPVPNSPKAQLNTPPEPFGGVQLRFRDCPCTPGFSAA